MTINFVFLILAAICFLSAAAGIPALPTRYNAVGLGLFFWLLSTMIKA